jgi:GNAT superfamily N-acetyltransferase
MQIVPATAASDIQKARSLFEEYWNSFGFPPSFQDFASEAAGLPRGYEPPEGRLALALVDGEAAGCVALRKIDSRRCEAKRLYVREEYRGRGAGRALLDWLIAEARIAGYSEMLGDTLPAMDRALAMYERVGFERTGPYAEHPTPGAIYLRLAL